MQNLKVCDVDSVGVECALDVQERSEDALVLEKQEQNAAVQLKEKQVYIIFLQPFPINIMLGIYVQ